MSRATSCPGCGAKLQLDEPSAGRRYQCPSCQSVLHIKASAGQSLNAAVPAAATDQYTQNKPPRQNKLVPPAPASGLPSGATAVSSPSIQPAKKRLHLFLALGLVLAVGLAGILILGGTAAWWFWLRGDRIQPASASQGDLAPDGQEQRLKEGAKGEEVYRRLLKSTVWVYVPKDKHITSGSGQVIDVRHKWVLTNYHVAEDSREVIVFFPEYTRGEPIISPRHYIEEHEKNGQNSKLSVKGRVVYKDVGKDLALIEVDRLPDTAQEVALAAEKPRVGQTVFSMGASGIVFDSSGREDGALWRYIPGTVSQVYQRDFKYQGTGQRVNASIVETTLPTNPGDSGAAIVNERAELIGLVAGRDEKKQSVSLGIEFSEIDSFLRKHYENQGVTYIRPGVGRADGKKAELITLFGSLENPDPAVRVRSAQALGELESEARAAIPHLLPLLKDDNADVRRAASVALEKIKSPDEVDLPVLYKALEDKSHLETRRWAARLLAAGPQITRDGLQAVSRACTDDKDAKVREHAIVALGKYPNDPAETLKCVMRCIKVDQDLGVRREANTAFKNLLRQAFHETISQPAIFDIFWPLAEGEDENPNVRSMAGVALLFFVGPKHREVVRFVFEKLLCDHDQQVRKSISETIRELNAIENPEKIKEFNVFEKLDKADLPVLRKAITATYSDAEGKKLPCSEGRSIAVEALGSDHFAPALPEVLPLLIDVLLKEQEEDIRLHAVQGLLKFGREASKPVQGTTEPSEAVPALTNQLRARNTDLRRYSVELLGVIGHQPGVLPALIVALADDDSEVRRLAEDALDKMAPLDKGDVDVLNEALKDKNANVRAHAATALGKIGADARSAVSALTRCVDKNEEKELAVRIRAIVALGNIGPDAKLAIPLLADVLKEKLPEVRTITTLPSGFDDVKVYERAVKSTVWIHANTARTRSRGTGALISANQRLVLTNYHVVEGASVVTVFFPEDNKDNKPIQETDYYLDKKNSLGITGRVVPGALDPLRDLALIQLDKVPPRALRLPLASSSPSTGQQILSIGSSGADTGTLWRQTPGKVRGVTDKSDIPAANGQLVKLRIVETDSAVNAGDSGGPVVNGRGEMVAVVKGYLTNQRAVSWFIDIQEVWNYLNQLKPALQKAGLKWEEFTPDTREALGGTGTELRSSAVVALGRIRPQAKDPAEAEVAVRALRDVLKDKDATVRTNAVVALGALGDIASPAASDMVFLLSDSELEFTVVVDSISKLGEKAVQALGKALIEKHPKKVRLGVIRALGMMGPTARSALDDLSFCRRDRDKEIRDAATESFYKVQGNK